MTIKIAVRVVFAYASAYHNSANAIIMCAEKIIAVKHKETRSNNFIHKVYRIVNGRNISRFS